MGHGRIAVAYDLSPRLPIAANSYTQIFIFAIEADIFEKNNIFIYGFRAVVFYIFLKRMQTNPSLCLRNANRVLMQRKHIYFSLSPIFFIHLFALLNYIYESQMICTMRLAMIVIDLPQLKLHHYFIENRMQ